MNKHRQTKKALIHHEKYHNNCHDYLKTFYLEKYAVPIYKPLLYRIKEKIPKLDICNDLPENRYDDVIVCDQHAVIFGDSRDIYPILATYALNACIGLIMYIPKFCVGTIAHIDGLPGYTKQSAINDGININFDPAHENITIMLKHLRNLCGTTEILQIEYYLVGGIFHLSEIMIHDIVKTIDHYPDNQYKFIFKGRNLLGPENQSRNLCLDTKTGEIKYFDYIVNMEFYGEIVNSRGIPANIIKAPRVSEAYLDITYLPSLIHKN